LKVETRLVARVDTAAAGVLEALRTTEHRCTLIPKT